MPVFNDVTMENYPWASEAIQSLARQKIPCTVWETENLRRASGYQAGLSPCW